MTDADFYKYGAMMIPVAIIVTIILRKTGAPYKSKERFITPTETKFFTALKSELEPTYRIHPCVRVADVLTTKGPFKRNKKAFYQISSKHIDFLVSSPDASTMYAAIELDDKSHEKRERVKRDKFLNKAFEAAGMPLVRFKPSDGYNFTDLKKILQNVTSAKM